MSDTIAKPPEEGELRAATLCQTLHLLASGRVDSLRLTQVFFDAMARANPRLNAYITQAREDMSDAALRAARLSDVRRASGAPRGRLDGIPIAVKDNIDVAGYVTSCGLPLRGNPASTDAHVVERLRGAGAVILGKTNLDEASLGASGKNPHFGNVENPWRQGFVAGGSSAGSAVAVAAGLCTAAIGSDSLGSMRIPASYCGVYALKPTPGEISTRGLHPAARRLDGIGLVARGVDDLAVLLHVLADEDAQDPRSRRRRVELAPPDWEPGKLRTGVLGNLAAWDTQPAVASLFAQALEVLRHELSDRRIVDFADFSIAPARRAAFFLMEAEMLGTFGAQLADSQHPVSAQFAALVNYARGKSAADYAAADRVLDAAVLKARRLFAEVDVLVTPTTPQTAFDHAAAVPASQADFTCFANLAGCPAVSLPMGTTPDGLPVGMQLLGPPGSDLRLLELAEVCAAALDTTPVYPVGV
jgi:Asp-tRNA(Asn)/Glu-tRNA(Gln) amidotransferase A subunit family amidase